VRSAQDLTARHSARRRSIAALVPLGLVLLLSACESEPPPGPAVVVLPGRNKDLAAFQQDDLICRQHAAAKTGYSGPGTSGAAPGSAGGSGVVPAPAGTQAGSGNGDQKGSAVAQPADEAAYAQCMAARGDVVQSRPWGYPAEPPPYGYPYEYAPYGPWVGYPYDFPYFLYGGGLYGGFGWARDGYYHGTWHRGGFARGGFARGGFARGGLAGRGSAGSGHGRGGGGHH
jgi:hypothetical protein